MKRIIMLISMLLACPTVGLLAQTVVSGVVSDENGEPMIGVGVVDRDNPSQGTVTDLQGKYRLTTSAKALEFSFFGYDNATEQVDGRTEINVRMKPRSSALDEVVVIGYGTSKKGDLTGSVAVVDMKEIRESSATSLSSALQGRVAGADFSSGTGELGEDGIIHIRGTRSLSAGNEPLIIVDGVIDAVSSLNDINPDDIVDISILKDISSTAIYGSRGANGVILITTEEKNRKNASSKISVTLDIKAGAKRIANSIDIMDATELATYRNLVKISSQNFADGAKGYYDDPTIFGKGTDWVRSLSRTGVYQDYYLRLNGKVSGVTYAASLGYTNEKGILVGTGLRRLTGVLRMESEIAKSLTMGARISISDSRSDQSAAAISGTSTAAAIYLSPLLDTGSTWNKYGSDETSGGTIFNNPYIVSQKAEKYRTRNIINISPYLKYKFCKHFVLNARYTYTRNDLSTYIYNPSDLPSAAYNKTGGSGTRSSNLNSKHNAELTLNYKNIWNKRHNFEALGGATLENTTIDYRYLNVAGVMDDRTGVNSIENYWDPGMGAPKSHNQYITRVSGFVRANYIYDRRYHVSATLRADGSSLFASGKKWGYFPSLAFRWSAVNEKWLKNVVWLNDLSLRLSVGRSGNDAIGAYNSLATISSTFGSWLFGDGRLNTAYPEKLANSDITWETTDAINAGLNFDVLHNRISMEVDTYLSYTKNLLLSTKLGYVTGYGSYMTNAGQTRNSGVEFTLKTVNVKTRAFEWSTSFTLAHNEQIVTDADFDGLRGTYENPRNAGQIIYGFKSGYPRNSLWGYQFCGVWSNEEEYLRNKYTKTYVTGSNSTSWSSTMGKARYLDINHDGVLDSSDEVYLGCSDPVVYGGFQNTFRIARRLELGIYFAYSFGGCMYNISEVWLGAGGSSHNHYRYMLNAWTPDNPDSNIPRADRIDYYCSDTFVHDASFIRLKSLNISYDFTPSKPKFFKSIIVSVSGENLWLWKNYNGFDPDVNAAPNIAYRLDTGSLPRPMSFIGKVSLKF